MDPKLLTSKLNAFSPTGFYFTYESTKALEPASLRVSYQKQELVKLTMHSGYELLCLFLQRHGEAMERDIHTLEGRIATTRDNLSRVNSTLKQLDSDKYKVSTAYSTLAAITAGKETTASEEGEQNS